MKTSIVCIPAVGSNRLEAFDGNECSMMSRASSSDDTALVATICMAMLPSALASTGPATCAAGRVGGELIEQPVSRAAADDANLGDGLP